MASLAPEAFAKRWADAALSERSSYQQHVLDLCDVIGAPKPAEKDPKDEFYTFEKGVEKTGGGKGFADVWFRDHFAIEYKGRHKDLGAAYGQLLQYRESLENPPVLVVTDTDRFEVHTNFTGTVTEVYAFTNEELPEPGRSSRPTAGRRTSPTRRSSRTCSRSTSSARGSPRLPDRGSTFADMSKGGNHGEGSRPSWYVRLWLLRTSYLRTTSVWAAMSPRRWFFCEASTAIKATR